MTTVTIGAIHRRDFRRWLQSECIAYKEDRGWLDSQFVFDTSVAQAIAIKTWFKRLEYESEIEWYLFKVRNKHQELVETFLYDLKLHSNTKSVGWFNTTYEIECHPTVYTKIEKFVKNL